MRQLWLILVVLVLAGCRSAQVDEATLAAARHNVTAWEAVKTYVVLHGRQDTEETKAATALMLKRARAFCAQAHAIVAGLEGDKDFDAKKAYEKCGEVDVP